MSQQELDAMFRAHDAGPSLTGKPRGTAIIAPRHFEQRKDSRAGFFIACAVYMTGEKAADCILHTAKVTPRDSIAAG